MTQAVRWGVLGSGGIAKRRTIPEGIIPAKNAKLVSIYDIDLKVNSELAEKHQCSTVTSIYNLLDNDIDVVYVATPVSVHCEQVLECAKAGKHILCEKPFGSNVAEAKKIIKACEDANVLLGSAFMMRFHSQHQAALKMVESGKLGKLTYGRAQLSAWYPPLNAWRQDPKLGGGGSLIDMGSQCINLLQMYFGEISKVSCFINNIVHDYQPEDSATVMLFFKSGALATVDAFFCIPDNSSKNVLELYGSKGSILALGTIGQGDAGVMKAFLEKDVKDYDAAQDRDVDEGEFIKPKPVNTYKAEIEEFSQAVIERRRPSNDANLGLENQRIVAASYESAKLGKVVDIQDFE